MGWLPATGCCSTTRSLARVVAGLDDCLTVGNLDSLRDWGHARGTSPNAGSTTKSLQRSVRSVRNLKTGGGTTWPASASRCPCRNDALGLRLPAKAHPSSSLTSCSRFSGVA